MTPDVGAAAFTTTQNGLGGGETLLLDTATALREAGRVCLLSAPYGSAVAQAWRDVGGEFYDGRPVDVCVHNDFRSARLWTGRSATRVFIAHGWWQTSLLRNAYLRQHRVRVEYVSTPVGDAVRQRSRGLGLDVAARPLPVGPGARYRPPTTDERASARRQLNIFGDEPVLGFVGRYQDVKRPWLFIQLLERMRVRGVMACSATFGNEAEQAVRDATRRAADGSSLTTLIEGLDPLQVYWACDTLVSTSEFESLGIAIMEALACGRAAVSTARGGPKDYLTIAGSHLPGLGLDDLVESVAHMLSDPPTNEACRAQVEGRGAQATAAALMRQGK